MTTVVIVSLGRGHAMGEVRRVASWRQLFSAAGATVTEITVDLGRRPHVAGAGAVLSGDAAPERLAWAGTRLRDQLQANPPDLVVAVSTRAYDPRVFADVPALVLDQVDSLARSYRDRAAVVDGIHRRAGYRLLGALHGRVERRLQQSRVARTAAGWTDARSLGATWVPNLVDPDLSPVSDVQPDTDLLFVGTLRYPPNVDALERLATMWPSVQTARPGTTLLVAGSSPIERVRVLCKRHGWELVPDFPSLPALAARARAAVAPLCRVAGLQNKVLDAAALALPQVVSAAALEGFAPGFPLTGHRDDREFVADVVRLLDDPATAAAEARTLHDHVQAHYTSERWVPWAREAIDHGA